MPEPARRTRRCFGQQRVPGIETIAVARSIHDTLGLGWNVRHFCRFDHDIPFVDRVGNAQGAIAAL